MRQTANLQDTAVQNHTLCKAQPDTHAEEIGNWLFTNQHWKSDKNLSDSAVYLLGINNIITE